MDLARNLIGRINVGDSLTRSAAARPGQLAVVDGDRRYSYAEFNAYVNRLAHGLAGLGYERGAVLALASGNSADFLAVYFACAKLGLVCVPINLGWRPDEVAFVLGHSRARGIVVETQLIAPLRDAIAKESGGRRRHRRSRYRPGLRAAARRPGLDHDRGPDRARRRQRTGYLRRGPGRAELPVHLRHDLVPQGRGRLARGHLPGVDVGRAGLRLAGRRQVRRHDADVPHRPAERVLHPRDHGRRDHLRAARLRPGVSCST